MAKQDIVFGPSCQLAEFWLRFTDEGKEFVENCDCGRHPRNHIKTNDSAMRGVRGITVYAIEGNRGARLPLDAIQYLERLEHLGDITLKWIYLS